MGRKNIPKKEQDALLLKLAKQFGEGYAERGELETHAEAIPTGHDDLDSLLTKGAHGIYLGGIIELMGSEGSGKTSLALRTVGYAQRLGYLCCWFDAEAAFDSNVANLNGCDPTQLIIPDLSTTKAVGGAETISFLSADYILEMIYKSVISQLYGIVVLDSVAGLMPEKVLQDDFDPNKAIVGETARSMSKMLGKIAQACKRTGTSVIFINQLRDKIGDMYPDRFHTPGGKALKFFSHQRISVNRRKGADAEVKHFNDDGTQEIVGHYARVNIVKNRKAPPVPKELLIDIPIYYKEYFPDNAKKCYDLARQLQVITIRNGILTWKDAESGDIILQEDGEAAILNKIRENELEPNLAAACVIAANDEKNLSKKAPVKISKPIEELAETATEKVKKEAKAAKKTGKKATSKTKPPALDLDDGNDS